MQGNIDDFFIPDNEVLRPDELDYNRVEEYIRTAEAFSRSTYQSIYIIDYYRHKFLYVSPNSLFLCGLTPEQMLELNYNFYLKYVPEEEQDLLIEYNRVGFAFYHTLPREERSEWYIQYDFHIINNGKPVLINHKLTPIALTSDGRVWLALCVVSPSSHTTPGHIELHRSGSPEFYEYNRLTRRWNKRRTPMLTDYEKSVLTLSIQGYTMAEIGEKMYLSPDTIKKYRKQLYEKLGVHNISEAIAVATNNKLL